MKNVNYPPLMMINCLKSYTICVNSSSVILHSVQYKLKANERVMRPPLYRAHASIMCTFFYYATNHHSHQDITKYVYKCVCAITLYSELTTFMRSCNVEEWKSVQ